MQQNRRSAPASTSQWQWRPVTFYFQTTGKEHTSQSSPQIEGVGTRRRTQFRRSSTSFSVMVGRSTATPGRLQFLRSLRIGQHEEREDALRVAGGGGAQGSAVVRSQTAARNAYRPHPIVAELLQMALTVPAMGSVEVTVCAGQEGGKAARDVFCRRSGSLVSSLGSATRNYLHGSGA